MAEVFLDQPHHVTAGFVGVPGDRTFFIQVEDAHQRVTLLAEKGQVAGIGELLTQLLVRVDDTPADDWDVDAMALREPVEAAWRIGDISVGLDPDLGRFILELNELVFDPEGGDSDDEEDPDTVRFTIDQDQARRLAAHCAEVVGKGRPRCRLCGRVMEDGGSHTCPSTNGHGHLTPR